MEYLNTDCIKCGSTNVSVINAVTDHTSTTRTVYYKCNTCSHEFSYDIPDTFDAASYAIPVSQSAYGQPSVIYTQNNSMPNVVSTEHIVSPDVTALNEQIEKIDKCSKFMSEFKDKLLDLVSFIDKFLENEEE